MSERIFSKAERAAIAEDFEGPGDQPAAAGVAAAGETRDGPFCNNWPATKRGLEAMLPLAKRPLVKFAIRQSIELGDIAFEARCGGTP